MTVEDPWKPFRDVLHSPWEGLRDWKERTGGKVVGHLLPDVPEEIIHSAGALPAAVQGAGVQVSHAQAHIPGYTCSHAMGALEMGLRGDLSVLDGMVIPYVCDTTRNLYHIWSHVFPDMPTEFLRLPKRIEFPGARQYLKAEFSRLLASVEGMTGTKADREGLRKSLELYNESREWLRKAYNEHLARPSLWTNERVHLLVESAMVASREDHLQWMENLPWDETESNGPGDPVPVYVRGKVWDPPGVLDLMDRLGLTVVADEIVTGFRGISHDVPMDVDPIEGLVDRHLSMIPYAGYHLEPSRIVDRFIDRVKAAKVKGVIFLNPKFCEAAAFDTPDMAKALEREQIPSLVLETSARGVSLGQIKLRLEAFREMLSDGLE